MKAATFTPRQKEKKIALPTSKYEFEVLGPFRDPRVPMKPASSTTNLLQNRI